jgi:hypothetical protein
MQRLPSICAQPSWTRIASVGQNFMQVVHPVQRSASRETEWMYSFIVTGSSFLRFALRDQRAL